MKNVIRLKISRILLVSTAVGLAAGLAIGGAAPASGQATLDEIYTLDFNTGVLASIDPATGVMTEVYQSSPVIGGSGAMYVDPISLEIVATTYWTAPWPIFTIDPGAGSQSQVSGTGKKTTAAAATPSENFIAYDSNGLASDPSELATIVSSNGAITDVAPITLHATPVRVSAMAYCAGEVYAFIFREAQDVYKLNTSTGALTLVLDTPGIPGTSDSIVAADCLDDGTLYATDQQKLLKSTSVTSALTLVAPLSGTPYTGIIETLTVASTGVPRAPGGGTGGADVKLADTGFEVETALVTGLIAGALTAMGILLVSRRRSRA